MRRSSILLVAFMTILIIPAIVFSLPSFPGAEGFGASSIGGRGGAVYIVTNLNDSGPGSLRQAVEANGPRIVVFRKSGTIELKSILRIKNPYITIAGQTAPGGGICLKDYELDIAANNVIVRFLRCRAGDHAGRENHGINIVAGKNIIVDHCSASWGVDEDLSCTTGTKGGLDSATVQWCFITEGLDNTVHPKGPHGKGSLINGSWGAKYNFHHNLYAHNNDRNPTAGNYNAYKVDPVGFIFDFRNNVVYNWGVAHPAAGTCAGNYGKTTINVVNNYYKTGPNTHSKYIWYAEFIECRAYVNANCLNGVYPADPWSLVLFRVNPTGVQKGNPSDFKSDWNTFTGEKDFSLFKLSSPVQVAPVKTDDAITAYDRILVYGGATLPQRDSVDARIVNEVVNGTGRIIDHAEEVGGWPVLEVAESPADSDRDGMPNDWETAHKLNPNDNSDAKGTNLSKEGYTNIEVFLNEVVANAINENK